MNYLGLDYGEAKIGVAIATGPLAEPLTTINNTNNALQIIKQLVVKNAIDRIIIGSCSSEFLQSLKKLGIKVKQVDETLSSHDAREGLLHTTQTKRRLIEHQVAAALILQNFLDSGGQK